MDEDLTKHSSYKKYTCIEKNDVKSNKLKYSPQHAAFQEPTKDQISPLPDSTSQLDFNILLDGIKKERIDTEVTEITLPFKPTLGDNFEIEIDRGIQIPKLLPATFQVILRRSLLVTVHSSTTPVVMIVQSQVSQAVHQNTPVCDAKNRRKHIYSNRELNQS
ncbi:unnamed protein product [Mytilus edulis]|uniref:Uncharacterized protein n=1 Tax=Mytilus edulis TaxID=6550 RepID=A0A8S3TL86_MYTED|nr:unnamed protein product [Mytilus edulis]